MDKVLLIDDEPYNLKLIQNDLVANSYDVLTAEDGDEGWELLSQYKEDIQVVLLDRMMPNMDGMELLKKIKNSESLANIPVIMQTAAAQKEQVIEGLNAGVYYYLTKPDDYDVMLSIVRAACDDYARHKTLLKDVQHFKSKFQLIRQSSFEVKNLDDARFLSTFLSNFFPDPNRVVLGISELLINAIEHGNLGITYEEKTKLTTDNCWEKEIIRRLNLDEYKDRVAEVHYEKTDKMVQLTIKDQGPGFNWKEYLYLSADRAKHNHGRGIAMTKMISFDEVEYIGCGNEVKCTVFR